MNFHCYNIKLNGSSMFSCIEKLLKVKRPKQKLLSPTENIAPQMPRWSRTADLLLLAMLGQACMSWPIREDWVFRREVGLKETVAKTEYFWQRGIQSYSTVWENWWSMSSLTYVIKFAGVLNEISHFKTMKQHSFQVLITFHCCSCLSFPSVL